MGSDTMEIPRLLGADVNGGSQLTEDTNDGSKVTLYSYQFNGKQTLDEANTEDAYVDAVEGYNYTWLQEFRVSYDNAALGVTGARSTTAGDHRPFNSLYYTLSQADATAGYTAGANITTGAATYDNLADTLAKLESSNFADYGQFVVIAHPAFRNALRKLKDSGGSPIFQVSGSNIDDDTLFGIPIKWSLAAQASSSFKARTGNKLLVVANRNALVHGRRIEPQARFIPAGINTQALEHTLQYRARKGFCVTVPQAAAILSATGV